MLWFFLFINSDSANSDYTWEGGTSRPSPFCQKLAVQWLRASAQPIPWLQPTTTLSQISFF